MKLYKSILIAVFGIFCTAYVNADETSHGKGYQSCSSKEEIHNTLNYIKLGGAWLQPTDGEHGVGPSVGIGRRYEIGSHAIDISANFSQSTKHSFYFSIPKVNYIWFLQPGKPSSFYAGFGGSLGGIHSKHRSERFTGLLAESVFGYEFLRNKCYRTFVELGISHPALTVGKYSYHFSPVVSLAFGVGF